MASSTILYYKSKTNSDGSHPIVLRFIFDRVPKYITICSVPEKHWDEEKGMVKASHPNSQSINSLIKTKDAMAYDLLMEYQKGKSGLTPDKIIATMRGRKVSETFFDYFCDYVEAYKARKKHFAASAKEALAKQIWYFVNNKKEFFVKKQSKEEKYGPESIFRKRSGKDLFFHEITSSFLRKFQIYLIVECGVNKRSAFNTMILIRSLYNRAIKNGVAQMDHYPFRDFKMSMPDTEKIGLDQNEIIALENAELKSSNVYWVHAKHAWLFSFCFGGMRISDVLKCRWDSFKNGRLYYIMGKNDKPVSIEIPDRARKILDYYEPFKEENRGYIFKALKYANLNDPADIERAVRNEYNQYNRWIKKLAAAAGITKKLSQHIARHSFGNVAGDSISIQLLQAIYRHTDIKTTINYQQHWMNKEKLDEAIKSVVNF